jgi:hypothetical protein
MEAEADVEGSVIEGGSDRYFFNRRFGVQERKPEGR